MRTKIASVGTGFCPAVVAAGLLVLSSASVAPAQTANMDDAIRRIREEGLTTNSQVMKTLSYLTDVIGPRLTGSPNLRHANEWTRDKLAEWGLANAHLEAWGPFGRGWALKEYRAEVVAPYVFPLIGAPKAWSPGMKKAVTGANVIYIDAQTEADLEKYRGKLKGAVVLTSPPRAVVLPFTPPATRRTESNLVEMANATSATAGTRRGGRGGAAAGGVPQGRILAMCLKEGAALAVSPTAQGDTGTIFVSQVALPTPDRAATNTAAGGGRRGGAVRRGPTYYSVDAPATPPQIMLAVEDYNRLVRMVQQGAEVKVSADLKVEFYNKDLMAYNTVAEIPGTDLKDEIVMLGGHMDSWQSGTGATDNGVGVGACMEAVRILKTLNLKPRRTIRIALWSGEEEGLLGSRAYVAKHFGSTNETGLVKGPEYDQLSAYFNLDNGSGKIRGIYMQGNGGLRALFTGWLEPFHDLDAQTVSIQGTGSTDHVSYDSIGLPGFQFIQDGLDYGTRTHHSNQDVYDRIQAEDMKQASTIMAAFVYRAAMMDEKIARKPVTATAQ